MSPARMQSCFAAWIVFLTAVFYAFPAVSMYSWAAIGLSAAVAVLVGVRVHRPSKRLPWYLLAGVLVSFTAGDTTYNVLTDYLGQDNPFPSVADVPYLLVYPMLAVALLVFIRARSGADNRAALLDALVPTAGLGLLSWVFLISPYVRDDNMGLLEKLVSAAYPLGDVLALAMLLRLVTAAFRKPVALTTLAAGVTGLLATDVIYGLRQLEGTWEVGGPTDSGWIFFYTAVALAALHPSMRRLTSGGDVATESMAGGRRIAVMVLAALIAPAVLIVEDLTGGVEDAIMIATASGLMFLLVMARVAGLIQAQRDNTARERTLRMSAADLVTANSEEEAGEAVSQAVAAIVPEGEDYRFLYFRADAEPGEPTGVLRTGWVAVADLPPSIAAEMGDFESALFGEAMSASISGGTPNRNHAYLAADDSVLSALQASFEALMAQGTMAVERITLTAEINRRSSEDYFRALIQSASDVILIVGDDELIRYASPSTLPVFGRTDLVGTQLIRLFAGTDHAELRALLEQATSGHGSRDSVDLTAISGEDLLLQVEVTCRDLRADPAVGGLVVTIRDVTERRRLESDLAHQAYHDSLTGLANRLRFQNRLEQAALSAEATRSLVGVLFVDLDDFKEVNDTLGHGAGDQLLIAVGKRIAEVAGPMNMAARTGGDEFAVLIEHITEPDEVERVAQGIVHALSTPIEVSDGTGGLHLVSGAASVGVATSGDAAGITELLRRADVAMYVAKTDGKRTWRLYRDELHQEMIRRLEMRSALNEAVPGEQMRLRYQPIVDLPTGEVVGLEALVRWQHPARGLLGPNEFIELSEENGSVVAIGGWVLREALRTFVNWHSSPAGASLRYMSVNVSARQFRTPGFVDQVREVLAETGARPEWLLLEITESLVLHDADQVWADLRELRGMGIRIAIDDFGTGYSSLSYLSQMPVDVLKIDKSFIDDILHSTQQMALVETIVSLARTLELAVVAEGIELDGHRQALVGMGCPYGQGYLFSKPVTADEIHQLLAGTTTPR
ncbi:putative bifunctional diguanylate cyclase/phosphodiesterase [Paractinoplanes globisporus]|uniref:Bifunctional diguanylate cyclase/phosphodiesterase n=1 Tax=Paractinoplanes globisporus TaxID=113565 RepID=A0ABW6WFP6_9ACTN|nr:EAL domain-containing protein [Actinoplanes globisporus]